MSEECKRVSEQLKGLNPTVDKQADEMGRRIEHAHEDVCTRQTLDLCEGVNYMDIIYPKTERKYHSIKK